MIRLLPAICTVFVPLLSPAGQVQAPGQEKPVHTDVVNTYFKGPPDSLTEMILEADVVVRGRVVGALPRTAYASSKPFDAPMTAFQLQVLEILHTVNSAVIGEKRITILRPGGDRDVGSHIVRSHQSGFPPFAVGHDYLLFLVWNAALEAWVLAYGPDSAFDLTGGVVNSDGKAPVTNSMKGKPASDFLDRIRRYGR